MTHCLLVDDDPEIRALLLDYLQRFGLAAEAVADGASLRRRLPQGGVDMLLLDLMLPDENGLDLCRWVKHAWPRLPVIMLTAQGDPLSRVLGLEIGADDYLPKPFEPRELVARIKAVLRRGAAAVVAPDQTRFAGWCFDRQRRELVAADGTLVALSAAEFRLLCAFVDRPGRVLSREQLIEATCAPGVDVNERAIDLAVSRLRAKFGADARGQALIRTLRGKGYLFDARLEP